MCCDTRCGWNPIYKAVHPSTYWSPSGVLLISPKLLKMYRYVAFSLAMAAASVAQIPTTLTFHDLTTKYLPFISINTAYIFNDTRASQQLANAVEHPVTIFLSLDLPFQQFEAIPPSNSAAGQIEAASIANVALTSDLFQYIQLDGLHPSTSFKGASFMRTRFNDTKYENVTGGQNIEVFRNATVFYVGTGIGFKSNVLIPVCPSMSTAKSHG